MFKMFFSYNTNLNSGIIRDIMTYNKKNESTIFFIIIMMAMSRMTFSKVDLLYPASFTVVRYSSISVNLTTYMKNIGYPSIDQSGNNIGYNIISLDGYKTSMTFSSSTNDLSPLGTWINIYSRILGNAKNLYGKTNSDVQAFIATEFHKRGSKILFNCYSFQRPISEKNTSAIDQANSIAQFVNMYSFDGVSIDFDDFNSVKDKTASQWLMTFLKTLRKQIGKGKLIVLQIYPTFISEIPLFKNSLVNSLVDLFVIKYYNLLKQNYNTFATIFNKATVYNGTALWEIQKNSQIKIDICKTLVAKPSTYTGTWNSESFVSASTLNSIFDQARTQYSWFAGYANLDFSSDPNAEFQLAALNSLRIYCVKNESCFCF